MLFNLKWTKTEPSLAGLIVWLETKNPNECYIWHDSNDCLIAQYGKSIGWSAKQMNTKAVEGDIKSAPYYRISTANGQLALAKPHTFGAALARAKEALKKNG